MSSSTDPAALGATLEAAVVRALALEWEGINHAHFRRQLQPPVFLLSDATARLGRWSPADRTIEIARSLVLAHPWGTVVEVLKHEMAHQFVHEVLGAVAEVAHGPAFRRTCEQLGIDASAAGLPRAGDALPEADGRALQRIAKLLALAESPNRHEAELAMSEAQRLMLKHNLDEAAAGRRRAYGFRHLGEPTGRLQAHQRFVAAILASHFFVESIWVSVHRPRLGTSGTVLEICGSDANLEMASYVHDFLLATAERLWLEHKRGAGIRADAQRRSYLAGVMRGFQQKLDEERRESQRAGLVWVGDRGLDDYFDTRHPRRRTLRRGMRAHPSAFAAGEQAGRAIVLHRPVASSPSTRGRLLGPGSR